MLYTKTTHDGVYPDACGMPTSVSTRQRNGRFDTLRLLAALLVLWSHAFPLGGQPANEPLLRYTGVDSL